MASIRAILINMVVKRVLCREGRMAIPLIAVKPTRDSPIAQPSTPSDSTTHAPSELPTISQGAITLATFAPAHTGEAINKSATLPTPPRTYFDFVFIPFSFLVCLIFYEIVIRRFD